MHLASLVLSTLLFGQMVDDAPLWSAADDSPKPTAEVTRPVTPPPIARPQVPTLAPKPPTESAPPLKSISPTESMPPAAVPKSTQLIPPAGTARPTEPVRKSEVVAPNEGSLVPVRSDPHSITPPSTIANLFALPEGSKLTGQGLSLVDALTNGRTLDNQLEITHAYWYLAAAVAQYHSLFNQVEELGRFEARPADIAILRTVRSSAAASLKEAELAVISAQHELAESALLPDGDPLPLPSDQPHVGPYRTQFDELFSTRAAPGRVRLISRTLPLRRRAIDSRAAAVEAAEKALTATQDAYRSRQADLDVVLACMAQAGRQRRGLIDSVCYYNHDIVDYAVAVVGKPTSGPALVSMLIKPKGETSTTTAPKPSSTLGSPTLEQLQPIPPSSKWNEPTLAPPRAGRQLRPSKSTPPNSPPLKAPPLKAPPLDSTPPSSAPLDLTPPDSPLPVPPPAPGQRTTRKPIIDGRGAAAPSTNGLYPALVGATPASQAKHLAMTLHWDHSLPDEPGESIELADCLSTHLADDRLAIIGAFWTARQRAAEYQLFAQQAELLEALTPFVRQAGSPVRQSTTADRLGAARSAAEADRFESHVELLQAQFDLTRRANRPLDSAWLLPATVPHSGRYLLRLEALPDELTKSWSMRRLATSIPLLADSVQNHAAAAIEADITRASALDGLQAGSQPADRSLECIERQTEETLAFLLALTNYNRTIAQYALAVLPPNVPSQKLVETLIVVQ